MPPYRRYSVTMEILSFPFLFARKFSSMRAYFAAASQKLSPRKAAVIDKISSQLLRIAAPFIAPVVATLINFSLSSGSFPDRWKTAKVSPLYKSGFDQYLCYLSFLKLSRDSSSEIDLYVDDTTITSSADGSSMGRLQESPNTSVAEVFNWALANRLPLNEKKNKVLTVKEKRLSTKMNNNPEITCNGSLLTNVMKVKLLGLEIDEELSFSEHITTVWKKVTRRIGLLKKIMNYLPLKRRFLYYKEALISKCIIAYKRLQGDVPVYLNNLLKLNNNINIHIT